MRITQLAYALAVMLALCVTSQLGAQQSAGQRPETSRPAAEPSGWVRIAADFDRDGEWDAIDTIHLDDLQTAAERSRRRATEDRPARQPQAGDSRRGGEWEQIRLQGQIDQLRRVDLIGSDEKDVVIGRLRTDSGRTTNVYFGPTDTLSDLDLRQGDRVRVEGIPARLNEQPLVIARRVRAGERSITVRLPRRSDLRQFSGQVEALRTTVFRGRDGRFVLARLRLDNGEVRTANLGRQQELQELGLQLGDSVKLLARPGRINGRSALIAQLIRANNVTADVRESTNRTAFRDDPGGR